MLKKSSIIHKIILLIVLGFAIQGVTVAFFVNYHSDDLVLQVTGDTTLGVLPLIVSKIDSEQYERLARSLDIEDPYYEELRQYLLEMRNQFGLQFLYTESFRSDGETVYVVDGNEMDRDDFSPLGTEINSEEEMVDTEQSLACLTRGELGYGISTFEGETLISAYYPIKNSAGNIVGILGADFNANEVKDSKNEFVRAVSALIAAFAVMMSVLLAILLRILLRPLFVLKDSMTQLGEGDLTIQMPVNTHDEIGYIINEFNNSSSYQRKTIKTVLDSSDTLNDSVINIDNNMLNLEGSAKALLNTANELSALVEENAASTQELNAIINNLEYYVKEIIDSSGAGIIMADKVESKTDTMTNNFSKSQEKVLEVFENTQSTLKQALIEVKSIDQIKGLTEAILDISKRTNLLAINASIEAVHAGEAGRGFAIVANEVQSLAVSSKDTVVKIQEAVDVVISSVRNLSQSTETLLEFVEGQVNINYKEMLDIVKEYNTDVQQFKEVILSFKNISQKISSSVDTSAMAIEDIAKAANVGAGGIQTTIKEIVSIDETIKEVKMQTEHLTQNSEQLLARVQHFKV